MSNYVDSKTKSIRQRVLASRSYLSGNRFTLTDIERELKVDKVKINAALMDMKSLGEAAVLHKGNARKNMTVYQRKTRSNLLAIPWDAASIAACVGEQP